MTSSHRVGRRGRGGLLAMATAVGFVACPMVAWAGDVVDAGVSEVASATDAGANLGGAGGGAAAGGAGGNAGAGGGAPTVEPVVVPTVEPVVVPPPLPTYRVRILTVEKGTRRPLEGTAISSDTVPAGETDADGLLVLQLPIGPHQLEAQFPNHAPLRQRIDVIAAEGTEVTFRLLPELGGERFESEVRVTHAEKQRFSVNLEEARQTAGTSGDPVRVLASLPGVSQVAWPVALFVVRGSNPGNTGFFIDGIRVPAMFHLALGPSIINPRLVGSLDFFPGAYPETFGRYIAGIVSIQTAPLPTDRPHVDADATLYDAQALGTAPIDGGRGAIAVAARYSYTGPLLSVFDPKTHLQYGDYQLRFEHTLFGGRATMFAFGSLDRLDSTTSSNNVQTAALQFHRLDLRWSGGFAGGRLTTGVTGGYDAARSTLSQALLTVEAVNLAPRLVWRRPLGRAWEFELGADADLQRFNAHPTTMPGPGAQGNPTSSPPSDLSRSRPAFSQGTFTALRLHPNEHLLVTPGLRADYFAEEGTSRFELEPRLEARVTFVPGFALKGNFGRFTQMPSLPINVAGFESFGLRTIGLQRSDSASVGVDARLPADIAAIEVTGFYQRMQVTDLLKTNVSTLRITGPDALILHDGVAYGVEALLRRPATHRFYGWLAYTLSYSFRNGANGVVRSDWDQRHILNLVMGCRVGSGYTISGRGHYNTGRSVPVYTVGAQYRDIPPYMQIDLRAERRILFDRFVLDVFVDIANATFNRELVQYVVTRNGQAEPTYLHLVLPTIGLHGEF